MKKKKTIYLTAMLFSLLFGTACGNNAHRRDPAMAAQLFSKSVGVIKGFTDSINNAKDSATLKRLTDSFDGQLAKVNFEFPADTDLDMSIHQNDSLIHLLDKLVEAVKKKEKELNVVLKTDTVPADSISPRIVIPKAKPAAETVTQTGIQTSAETPDTTSSANN